MTKKIALSALIGAGLLLSSVSIAAPATRATPATPATGKGEAATPATPATPAEKEGKEDKEKLGPVVSECRNTDDPAACRKEAIEEHKDK